MPNRRKFIQTGLAFSTLSFTQLSALKMAVAMPEGAVLAIENFIVDSRFQKSADVAKEFSQQGVPVVQINGDLTDLWYQQYSLHWKSSPMTLAGLTGQDALFVLETLAPDYGMRVIHKEQLKSATEESESPDVQLYSWIIAPKNLLKDSV